MKITVTLTIDNDEFPPDQGFVDVVEELLAETAYTVRVEDADTFGEFDAIGCARAGYAS